MARLDALIEELVTANRILAQEGIVDSFGHVSVRHPGNPQRYLLSCARAPERVEAADIMEFTLEGEAIDARGRKPYLERFIHGAVYEARPDVTAVVHNHSPGVIPFGVTGRKLKPIMHTCATIGREVPVWDQRKKFGDTNLLVENMKMARDLAKALGKGRTALMRGHGCVVAAASLRAAVFTAVYLEVNARLQMQAESMGKVKFLSNGEVDKVTAATNEMWYDRAWQNWCRRAGRPYAE
ncbi:MAG TPA: class II aldolase/adducin family protein [Xanthobacteraceae bacterium]|nr:class II aldolase/adducin family protein [Xanthobacteraceae bacterium]